jgi:hypothetical protein
MGSNKHQGKIVERNLSSNVGEVHECMKDNESSDKVSIVVQYIMHFNRSLLYPNNYGSKHRSSTDSREDSDNSQKHSD